MSAQPVILPAAASLSLGCGHLGHGAGASVIVLKHALSLRISLLQGCLVCQDGCY